jgi:hypothetical protein
VADSLDLTFTAADVAGDPINEQFVPARDNLLLVWNKHATDPKTFTLNSAADDKKRTGDITAFSVGAGEIAAFRIKKAGWMQTTGYVTLEGSSADIWFCVLAL